VRYLFNIGRQLKVGMAEIFYLFFFFARISQSFEVILILACRFLLESSEAEMSIDIAVQSSRDAKYFA